MQGKLKKMDTHLGDVVEYTLTLNSGSQLMNDLIGKYIRFDWRCNSKHEKWIRIWRINYESF